MVSSGWKKHPGRNAGEAGVRVVERDDGRKPHKLPSGLCPTSRSTARPRYARCDPTVFSVLPSFTPFLRL
jgi:hypothetical protein